MFLNIFRSKVENLYAKNKFPSPQLSVEVEDYLRSPTRWKVEGDLCAKSLTTVSKGTVVQKGVV